MTVRFVPTSRWDYDYERLAIGSNDPDEPVVELALSGTGGASDQPSTRPLLFTQTVR